MRTNKVRKETSKKPCDPVVVRVAPMMGPEDQLIHDPTTIVAFDMMTTIVRYSRTLNRGEVNTEQGE